MYHVRFKESTQHRAEHLICKQRSFAVTIVLFILYGFLQCGHDIQLFEVQDSKSLDQSGETICCSFSFAIYRGLKKLKEERHGNFSHDWATCMLRGSIRTILAKSSTQETKRDKTFIMQLAWPDQVTRRTGFKPLTSQIQVGCCHELHRD